jgi:acyl-CoA thioesterase
MPQSRFERDTAVERVDEHRYRGSIDPGWAVIEGAAANGGYVMALAARAMRSSVPHPDPVTLTAHFLAPPDPGPVDIDVEVVRSGGRHSTVAGRLTQDGRERTRLLGTFTDLGPIHGDDDARMDRRPPAYPPIEGCLDFTSLAIETEERGGTPAPPIVRRFDHRVPAELAGWAEGKPLGRGHVGGYVRWRDHTPMDTLGLVAVSDCYPPAVFNTGDSGFGWVPTIELTVQIRRRPAEGYLVTRLTTEAVTAGGYLEEDGEFWDANGRLVALSRQLALAPR